MNDGAYAVRGVHNISGALFIPATFNGRPVTRIDDFAFEGMNISSVSIPSSITSIGNWAFANTTMRALTIPGNVNSIGDFAFAFNTMLLNVTLHSGVTSIGSSAFSHNHNLRSIIIPDSLTRIEDSLFAENIRLTDITIPNSVTSIGANAFANTGLINNTNSTTTIIIPNSVTSIDGGAFRGWTSNHIIFVCGRLYLPDVRENNWSGNARVIWTQDGFEVENNLLVRYTGTQGHVVIPNSVTAIGEGAFRGNSYMESVVIPSSVLVIDANAFRDNAQLRTVILERPAFMGSITILGANAFGGTTNLTRIFVPDAESLDAYQTAANWSAYQAIIRNSDPGGGYFDMASIPQGTLRIFFYNGFLNWSGAYYRMPHIHAYAPTFPTHTVAAYREPMNNVEETDWWFFDITNLAYSYAAGIRVSFLPTRMHDWNNRAEAWWPRQAVSNNHGMARFYVFNQNGVDISGIATFEDAEDMIANTNLNITRIFFYSRGWWAQPHIHAWGAGVDNNNLMGNWPGTPMIREAPNSNWWFADVPRDANTTSFSVIINMGGVGGWSQSAAPNPYINNRHAIFLRLNNGNVISVHQSRTHLEQTR